jgi:hypothetical protein
MHQRVVGIQRQRALPGLRPELDLADRLLAHPRGDAHAAGRDLALADRELLLDLLNGLALPAGALGPGALVALDEVDGRVDLVLGGAGGDQGLAAAGGLGVAAGVVLGEAALDDRGQDLFLAALEQLDVVRPYCTDAASIPLFQWISEKAAFEKVEQIQDIGISVGISVQQRP